MADLLRQGLARARRRLSQRMLAISRDVASIDEAQAWAERAQWLVSAAARAPRGARSLEVSDWSSGEERTLSFPLDPSRPAREQVEAVFTRARRLRRGRPIAEARRAEAKRALEGIDEVVFDLDMMKAAPELPPEEVQERVSALVKKASILLPRDLRGLIAPAPAVPPGVKKALRPKPGRKLPFRTFYARTNVAILVGRRAESNDELTFQVSRPHHYWLHAKDQTGAHVIVLNTKNKTLTEEELVDAAHLAAHFSDARDEPIVDVLYTERRYVRKPRGSAPGQVLADRAKVIVLRVDTAHLERLLASEIETS